MNALPGLLAALTLLAPAPARALAVSQTPALLESDDALNDPDFGKFRVLYRLEQTKAGRAKKAHFFKEVDGAERLLFVAEVHAVGGGRSAWTSWQPERGKSRAFSILGKPCDPKHDDESALILRLGQSKSLAAMHLTGALNLEPFHERALKLLRASPVAAEPLLP